MFEDYDRMVRCIDDNLIWDTTIEDQFYRACLFLDKCASHGIILNPEKFQFAQTTLDFLGFTLTSSGFQPTEDKPDLCRMKLWNFTFTEMRYRYVVCIQGIILILD